MLSSKNGNMVYLEDKETSMQSLLAFRGTNLSSNRDKLFRSLTETKRLVEIIRTYPEYLQKIQLSDDYGESFDFSEPKVLDAAELREYLSQFNGVNADQLRIVNLASMQEDGYFHVKVPVKGNAFEFKLDPDGHVLYETTFTTPKGELVTTYKGYVVNLDEKADQLSKLGRSAGDDERKKFLFDFKNVFDNMFFYVQEPGDIPIQGIKIARDNPEQSEVPAETSGMSAETQIFIERELMRKDFNYIAETLKIGFNDVYATIVNGKYDITVRPIFLSVMGDQMSQIQFSAKYDFAAHSFVDVEIKAFDKNSLNPQPKLGGRTIRFANPSNLFIKSVKERIGELGFYIEAAESVISQSPADGDIMIDFVNKTVTIGSRTVPVNTSPVR
ncbi:MAG TPA: hypothetical protein PK765_02290 [bacterium]|nr:hypothetical protein [bacterium]